MNASIAETHRLVLVGTKGWKKSNNEAGGRPTAPRLELAVRSPLSNGERWPLSQNRRQPVPATLRQVASAYRNTHGSSALRVCTLWFASLILLLLAALPAGAVSDGTVVAWGNNESGQTTVPAGLTGVRAIDAGYYHTVALKSDGTLVAWGSNDYGQTTVPAGLTGVSAVAAGLYHTVALKSDGTVVAWGFNEYGQTTVPAGLTGVTAISAGVWHTVALKSDGTVVAWGRNNYGQTTVPVGLTGVASIAAGGYHAVALKSDGTVVAWGQNVYGQTTVPAGLTGIASIAAGDVHTVALKSDGTVVAWGRNIFGQTTVPAGLSGVTAIAAGDYYTVALKSNGTLVAWGRNIYGETIAPPGLTGVTAIAGGVFHTVAIQTTTTTVSAWGNNDFAQTNVPSGLSGITEVAGGRYHSLALKNDGTVVGWGANSSGQATPPVGLSGVTAISAGEYHSMALKSDGTVLSWGIFNYNGYVAPATAPAGLSGVVAVASASNHSVALKSDGTVTAWGYNMDGQTNVPAGLSGVVAIAAGDYHSLAVKSDGTVVAWGYGGDGRTNVPVGLNRVVRVAGGNGHSLALKSDGTVVGWGNNVNGQISIPAGLSGVVAIDAGDYHSMALKSDGTVVAWGTSPLGQVTPPAGLSGVVAIAGGHYHSLAITGDFTPPTLTPVSIASNNANPAFAKAGDTVTLSFTSSETIQTPTVTIAGKSATVTNTSGNIWTGTITAVGGDPQGAATFSIVFKDLANNNGATVLTTTDASSVTIDTLVPTLTPVSIASNNANPAFAKAGDTVTLSFTASETIQTPTVTIAGTAGTVANTGGNVWAGTISVSNGYPQGAAAFSVGFKDLANNDGVNVSATTDASGVTIDTQAPVLTLPPNQSAEATGPSGAIVTYPAATATDNFTGSPLIGYSQASGTTFSLGTTNVSVTATDGAGNISSGTLSVVVRDTTPPILTMIGANPQTFVAGQPYSDPGATAVDLVDGTLTVLKNSNVNPNVAGSYSVVYTATDSHTNSVSATRSVIVKPNVPISSSLFSQNGPVPGAGASGSGIPAGATWTGFGIPSINNSGTVAVIGSWRSPTSSGTGIFVGGTLAVKTGNSVPGLTGVTWRSFKDPVLAADGGVAFVAQIAGSGVFSANNTLLVSKSTTGLPVVVARTGTSAPGTGGAKFREFEAFSIDGPSVAFAAELVIGTGSPIAGYGNDLGVWVSDPANALALVLRKGQPITLSTGAPTRLKAFDFLDQTSSSPGMGRGHHAWSGSATNVRFTASLTDGRWAQMRVVPGGTPVAFSESGTGVGRPAITGATFRSFWTLASDHEGTRQSFLAALTPGLGGVTSSNALGIFLFNPAFSLFDVIARQGVSAPGTNGVFSDLKDPVFAADGSALAWMGTVRGGTVHSANDTGIWWKPEAEPTVLVVREGAATSGVAGAKWKSFDSLALPATGRGPIFVARMDSGSERSPGPGGVTNATDRGVWAVDSTDTLQLLFRQGVTQIGGKRVKNFTVLHAEDDATGVTRSFNADATVVWRAEFTDGTSAIIQTTVP